MNTADLYLAILNIITVYNGETFTMYTIKEKHVNIVS